MKKRRKYWLRTFECPECGNKVLLSKCKNATANGHKKSVFCFRCGFYGNMEQIDIQSVKT